MLLLASQVALVVKSLPTNAGYIRDAGLIPGVGKVWSLEEGMAEPHGQRNLEGYCMWGLKESDTTEAI